VADAQQLIFDVLLKDNASRGLIGMARTAKDAAGDVKSLQDRLVEVSKASVKARVGLDGNKEASAEIDRLQSKLIALGDKTANPNITVEGALKARAQIESVQRQLDQLNRSTVFTRLAGKGFLQPSLGGSLLTAGIPAVIAAAPAAAGAVGLVTASFGAAAVAAGGFGLVAGNVLTQAAQDSKKLQQLNLQLNSATTKSAKDAVRAQISALQQGWTPAFRQVMGNLETLSARWKGVSVQIAAPAVATWLDVVNKGLLFMKPLLAPVADLFQAWGQSLDKYFSSAKGSAEIKSIAGAVGQFAAIQLADVVQFIKDLGVGIFNLTRDVAGAGVKYGQFGGDLQQWGDAFASWSKSKQARDDVGAFVRYIRENGSRLISIAGDLAKFIPGIFAGASAAGTLELRVLSNFLGWIAKLPPSWAKPLTEVIGGLLLLSKTGVLKVGIQIVGKAYELLTGGTLALGGKTAAAQIEAAMVSGGDQAAAAIREAMQTGGATAGGEEGAAVAGAGTRFGSKAGGSLLDLAGPIGLGIAGGILANDTLNKILPPGVNKARQPFTLPGVVSGFGGIGGLAKTVFEGATAPVRAFWDAVTGGADNAAKHVQDASKKMNTALDVLRFDTSKLSLNFQAQGEAAKTASTGLDDYTTAIYSNGVKSRQAQAARQQLIIDMEAAGINSKKANTDVSAYTSAVRQNGIDSDAAQRARRRLVSDIEDAWKNSRQGRTDVSNYTRAVEANGASSDRARAARQRLIRDLENSGIDAKTARGLVDKLTGAISRLHGKDIHIIMTGSGTYNISAENTPVGRGGHPAHAVHPGGTAAGGYIRAGTGPTADDVIARVSKGELIVPAHMVASGAVDHLRGAIPGFARGGVAGNLTPGYITNMYATFQKDMTAAMVAAMRAAIRSAAAAARAAAPSGGGYNASYANEYAYAKSLFPSHGWGLGQWPYLLALWNQESGWNPRAQNPSSGAAGIPQDITGNFHGGYRGQIAWGENYIAGRYGTPAGAWAHEKAYNWYGSGFQGIIGKPTLLGVGERGPERVSIEPLSQRSRASAITFEFRGASGTEMERFFIGMIQKYVTVHGGDVQTALGQPA
jgi:hypothetical protein